MLADVDRCRAAARGFAFEQRLQRSRERVVGRVGPFAGDNFVGNEPAVEHTAARPWSPPGSRRRRRRSRVPGRAGNRARQEPVRRRLATQRELPKGIPACSSLSAQSRCGRKAGSVARVRSPPCYCPTASSCRAYPCYGQSASHGCWRCSRNRALRRRKTVSALFPPGRLPLRGISVRMTPDTRRPDRRPDRHSRRGSRQSEPGHP